MRAQFENAVGKFGLKTKIVALLCTTVLTALSGAAVAKSDVTVEGYASNYRSVSAISSLAKANPASVDYNVLDYGLYFFGRDVDAQKWTGSANPFFNPTKPTVVFFHGWQPGGTQKRQRETFFRYEANLQPNGSVSTNDLTASWRQKGWNVAICYWNQFADEAEVKDAEAKIWVANGPRGMRWRNASGAYTSGPAVSAGTLCADSIASAMRNFSGSQLRLSGHSLGAQMAITVANQLSQKVDAGQLPAAARPGRVALLDHAFLKDARSYLNNRWTGEVARDIVSQLKNKGIIFESYRSSWSTSNPLIGDSNQGLNNMTAFTEIRSPFFGCPWCNIPLKHEHAVWWYFWSMSFTSPVTINNRTGNSSYAYGPSASVDDTRLRTLMNGPFRFYHSNGADSRSPVDDQFSLYNR